MPRSLWSSWKVFSMSWAPFCSILARNCSSFSRASVGFAAMLGVVLRCPPARPSGVRAHLPDPSAKLDRTEYDRHGPDAPDRPMLLRGGGLVRAAPRSGRARALPLPAVRAAVRVERGGMDARSPAPLLDVEEPTLGQRANVRFGVLLLIFVFIGVRNFRSDGV